MAKFKAISFLFIFILMACSTINKKHSFSNKPNDYYPAFSWETVPITFHFGKRDSLMTLDEARFVTSRASFICLEKGHAIEEFGDTETGIEKEARQLKSLDPEMKVIFYWNTFLDYPFYKAHEIYENHPEWWLRDKKGEVDIKPSSNVKRYDLSLPVVRNWWTGVAKKGTTVYGCDGIFMDAFPQIISPGNVALWGEEKYNAIQQGLHDLVRETRKRIGSDKIIFYNGIRSTDRLKYEYAYSENIDGAMIEHFGEFQSKSKENMMADIQAMTKAGKSGKIIVFKAWPGFNFMEKEYMSLPLEEKRKIAKKNITFSLAAFLAGAEKYSYFIYNWGYRIEDGALEWYPELDMPLGKPLNDTQISGWELSRDFEHLSVWVNLETKEARITPR